jgi:hypothetical protein
VNSIIALLVPLREMARKSFDAMGTLHVPVQPIPDITLLGWNELDLMFNINIG